MGFNKRYINKEIILSNLSTIDILLKSDGLTMDVWSSNFIKDLNNSVERVKSYFDIKVSKIFDNAKIS
jgi:hypothetical protein